MHSDLCYFLENNNIVFMSDCNAWQTKMFDLMDVIRITYESQWEHFRFQYPKLD